MNNNERNEHYEHNGSEGRGLKGRGRQKKSRRINPSIKDLRQNEICHYKRVDSFEGVGRKRTSKSRRASDGP